MDEFNEAVEVFGRDLYSSVIIVEFRLDTIYSIVLLVEVVHVSVEDLDEKLDGYRSIHACIGDSECSLQALEYTLAVAVELGWSILVSCVQ